MLEAMARLAAIYTRISLDDGSQSSTARQERLCRAWVEERGWEIAGVYEDVDRSAYDTTVRRDAYEGLLADVAAKRVDVVVCWRLDRLARSPGDFERFLSACQNAGVEIASATEPVDSTTPTGIALVRMLVTFAGLESDVRGLRLRAKAREDADSGRQPNGGPPYGLGPECTVIVECEAALIREAVQRVLDGEGCTAIARSWAARGVVGRSGKPWSADGIRRVLRGRAICGDRMHRGRVAAEGCWPSIIDPLVGAQVRLLLVGRTGSNPRGSRNHLLRGLLRCGTCGEKLVVAMKQGTPFFICRRGGHVVVTRAPTEEWVTERVLARIEARHTNRVRWRRQSAAAAIETLGVKTASLRALNRSYHVLGEITHPEWLRARDELLVESRKELARATPQPHPRGLPPRVPIWRARSVWDELSISARREVLGIEMALVVVQKAPSDTSEWCSDRLEFVWLQPDPVEDVPTRTARRRVPELWELGPGNTVVPSDLVPSAEVLRSRGQRLTISEACRLTSRPPSTINSARRRGRLESEFIQGAWRYRIEDLDHWQMAKRHDNRLAPESEALLTASEAARLLGVDADRLESLVHAGTLTSIRHGANERAFSLSQIRSCQ